MATRREREKSERRKTDARGWADQQSRGFEPTAIKLPEGFEYWKPTPGVHKVDFMPYVAGAYNRRADEGIEHFELQYEAHRVPVPGGKKNLYLCPFEMRGKKCAVCDWLRSHGGSADPALLKSLRLTLRHLWIVNDKPGDEKNKLKVFDSNHFNRGQGFGEMMADAIRSVEAYGDFADLKNGYTLQLTVKEMTFPDGKYNAVTRIDFLPRKYEYSDKMLSKAPTLDDALMWPKYDDVMNLLVGGGNKDDDEDEDDRDEDDDKPAKRKRPKDDDEDTDDDDDRKDTAEDDEDEDEAPRRKKKKPAEDDDEDEDVEPPAKKKRSGEPTAEDLGLKLKQLVLYKKKECEIVKISGDGTSLTLEDEEGEPYRGIAPSDVKVIKGPSKARDDDDEDEEDEDEAPPKKRRK